MNTHQNWDHTFYVFATVCSIAFCLQASAAQFEDVTASAGFTNVVASSMSFALGDYNNDGYIDVYIATSGKNALYRNNKNGTFTQVGAEAGPITTDSRDSIGCAWLDFNNDGYRDMFSDNGGWSAAKNNIYWNNGDGTFGQGEAGNLTRFSLYRSWPACADYDGDGWVDIYVGEGNSSSSGPFTNRLYHATPSGTFTSTDLGPAVAYVNAGVWGDYDNDGDPDLFLSCMSSPSRLWRNDGGGRFTVVTNGPPSNMGTLHAAWADFDRDGDLDIALGDFGGTRLYRNDGSKFTFVTNLVGAISFPAWADYDNDGYLDLLGACGQNSARKPGLYHNNGDGTFSNVVDVLIAPVDSWMGGGWGDFDNDGFMDVFLITTYGRNRLYHNLTNANHWIKFKLLGTASNKDAIGAKVRVQATIGTNSVWQMQEVNGGYQFQNDTRLNFGLGDATNVDLVRIEWPSGNVQELTDLTPNQIKTVTEQTFITPVRPTGSLGSTVALTSQRSGTWQWYHDGVLMEGKTNKILSVSNLAIADGGRYSVVVDTGTDVLTNYAYLFVDTQFTKITEGSLVTDLGTSSIEAVAGDYDADGYDDLFVPRWKRGLTSLYHNNQNGTFTTVPTAPSQTSPASWGPGAWGDFDNDGRLDLLAIRDGGPGSFYWNNGGGTFTSTTFDTLSPWNVGVADYDRDGLLDLYFSYLFTSPNRLYHNNGDRTFKRMLVGEVGPPASASTFGGVTWADYDDDGWPDLCAPHHQGGRVYMYHNEGNGRFISVSNLVTQQGSGIACAWGDCDNDGKLDLFLASLSGANRLYLNAGGGSFKSGSLRFGDGCNGASWADYDNDGFLDLFVSGSTSGNKLYHNNGDGSFTKISTGSIVTDKPMGGAGSYWGTWFDCDNNGSLDLYVVNGDDNASINTSNFFYCNNGNSNAWLKVKLIGTTSNRDAVGAKVRVQATYAGQSRSQRRDITGGDAVNGAQSYAHFGLGNATVVSKLKIEWPSGMTEEFSGVLPRQLVTIVEPSLKGALRTDGKFHLSMTMSTNRVYSLEVSSDLGNWTALTNCTGSANCTPVEFMDPDAPSTHSARYYRMKW